jgi:2-polyprenyl-6-hydroxyphenyl methylase / 3-demethylubiquinone-9 3-methyltransferase
MPRETASFYDGYWPANVPDFKKTEEHVLGLLGNNKYGTALDAGCGSGVCSLALAKRAGKLFSADISLGSLGSARALAKQEKRDNINFLNADLLRLPFKDQSFDLVFSWGVIHHTADPRRAFNEFTRVLKPGGTVILAIYLKTNLTFIHEGLRHMCLRLGPKSKRFFIKSLAVSLRALLKFMRTGKSRRDDLYLEAEIEDWFFVPEKRFYRIPEIASWFAESGLSFAVLDPRTGRFKSSSNFIVKGVGR